MENPFDALSDEEQQTLLTFFDGMSKFDAISTLLCWMTGDQLREILQGYYDACKEDDDS